MAYSEAGAYNVFVPTFDATGYMVSGFARNIADFAINRYCEIRPVSKSKGYYLRWKSEQAARVRYSDLSDMMWFDGADRPRGQDNLEQFEFEGYTTKRYQESFTVGKKTLEQADWPLHEAQTQLIAQQIMTGKTYFAATFLTNATWNTNQANVDGAGGTLNGNAAILTSGQNWTNGTGSVPNIKKTILAATNIINKVTLAGTKRDDMAMVISPDTAIPMAQSAEINAIMANSIYAMPNLTGEIWYNEKWALPDKLYGMRLIIDDTVRISTGKLLTAAPLSSYSYVIPTGAAYILTCPQGKGKDGKPTASVKKNTRPDADLEGNERDPSNYFPVLSTLVGFYYEEMTVEAMEFPWDRLVAGSVVTDFDMQLSSWKSGFQLLDCLG